MRDKLFILIVQVSSINQISYAQKNNSMYDEHLIPVKNKQGKWGYINTENNKITIEPKYDWVDLFQNGMVRVSVKNPDAPTCDNNGLNRWIDTSL